MALWLVRAGKYGEHLARFVDQDRIYLTKVGQQDLNVFSSKSQLSEFLQELWLDKTPQQVAAQLGQIWPFARVIKKGDWVVVPLKGKPAFHVAEITGPYEYDPQSPEPYYHSHPVSWIAQDVPRSILDQDLLYSLGAIQTICRIEKNDAESRIRSLAAAGWKGASLPSGFSAAEGAGDGSEVIDLEQLARGQIAQLIIQKFKGHGLARLVAAVLEAQGYSVYVSPAGPDKGIDILAAPGPLGFGTPRICVQVKSTDSPVDTPTMNQLIGAMQNVHADQGLLVSWGGFKSSVEREAPTQFFRVRLWNQDTLINELLAHYHRLDPDLRAELPLKQVWTVAHPEESEE